MAEYTTKAGNGTEELHGFVMLKDGQLTWFKGCPVRIARLLAQRHNPDWMRGYAFAEDGSKVLYA